MLDELSPSKSPLVVAAVAALFSSGIMAMLLMAILRPVRLWLEVPLQGAMLALALPHAPELCAAAGMRRAGVAAVFGRAYEALGALVMLTPLPVSGAVEHDAAGRCACVLRLSQAAFGLWLPLGLNAMAEARFCRRWSAAQRQHASGGDGLDLLLPRLSFGPLSFWRAWMEGHEWMAWMVWIAAVLLLAVSYDLIAAFS